MKERLNFRSIAAGMVAVVIGLLLLIFIERTIFVNIGCSLLASGLVILLTALFVERKDEDPLEGWGVKKVYLSRQVMNDDCDKDNDKAKHQIDVIAFGLKHFRDEYDVERLLKRGVDFRIITMNPDSKFICEREKEEGKNLGSIRNSIEDLIEWGRGFNSKKYKGTIEIKGYDCMTLDFYWRIDDTLYVGPYWYNCDSQQTISYCFTKGKSLELYSQYFEKLWNDSSLMKPLLSVGRR